MPMKRPVQDPTVLAGLVSRVGSSRLVIVLLLSRRHVLPSRVSTTVVSTVSHPGSTKHPRVQVGCDSPVGQFCLSLQESRSVSSCASRSDAPSPRCGLRAVQRTIVSFSEFLPDCLHPLCSSSSSSLPSCGREWRCLGIVVGYNPFMISYCISVLFFP